MLVIGLTGGIGSGKTEVANLFAARGAQIIDADVIAKRLTQPDTPIFKAIIEHFQKNILLPDGSLNRGHLREIIFSDHAERDWLEQLLHPCIQKEIKHALRKVDAAYCIVVIPLLIEAGRYDFINRVLVVDATQETQINRVMKRDNVAKEHVVSIINTQIDREARLAKANDVIENNGDFNTLEAQIDKLHQKYLKLAHP